MPPNGIQLCSELQHLCLCSCSMVSSEAGEHPLVNTYVGSGNMTAVYLHDPIMMFLSFKFKFIPFNRTRVCNQ
jgi:hypothetical protein